MDTIKEVATLYFNTRDDLLRVDLRKVAYFKADRNYTDVFFMNEFHLTLPTNLHNIENMLNDDRIRGKIVPFVRIGRSFIVNLSMIMHINIIRQELVLSDVMAPKVFRLPISKDALKELKDLYINKKI